MVIEPKEIDLEKQFKLFLKIMYKNQEQLPKDQYSQIKDAYYAAAAQILQLQLDTISEMPEPLAVAAQETLYNQAKVYWKKYLPKDKN